jgi:hypothetical protein
MAYVFFALLLFCASVMAHVFFCRGKRGSGLQAKAYILIAALLFFVYVIVVLAIQQAGILHAQSLWGLPFRITAGLIFILLIPVYLSFYVLTQLMSPSKKILICLSQRGSLTYTDIVACVENENFINTRLNDLLSTGCVREVEGRYILNASGQKIAAILNIMQHLLGRDIGG